MTIETSMSFPEEGESECPPDVNPQPTASSNSSSSASSEVSTWDSHSSGSGKKYQNWCNRSKKVFAISNSQRSKLRSSNKNPPLQISKSDESSKETANDIIANNTEIHKNDKCASTNHSAASTGEETDEDVKKFNKTRLLGGEGSKEEAASRKSMRLRLRRGRTDNSDDIFLIKERPRYVEDLISIDFNDDNHKIMFMDALGMSFNPKRAKIEFPSTKANTIAPCSLKDKEKVFENKSAEKGACENSERINVNKCECEVKAAVLVKNHVKQKRCEFMKYVKPTIESSETLISQRNNSISDDDDGWECWIQRLSSYTVKPLQTSPTKKEINESLIRLVRLGTEVKVVTHGLS